MWAILCTSRNLVRMKRTKANKAYALLMFFAVSALCGVLTAGLAVPFVAMVGGMAKAGADSLDQLPAELVPPPQSEVSRILMADGSVLGTFYDQNRVYMPLNKIHTNMQNAQIAIEDHRFYEHGAFDPTGTIRAAVRNTAGSSTQGGSTLTQQYVKQVLVNEATLNNDPQGVARAQEETVARKVRELRYAIALEKQLSKKEILERYLNIAYYGDGAYGVEAAARHFFGTSAAKLTIGQSAMLAGLVQNPNATNPRLNPAGALARRNVVLNRMLELNVITPEQATKARAEKFEPRKIRPEPNGCVSSPFPFICDYVRRTLVSDQMPSLGKTPRERENLLKRGGLTIQTLIDPRTQRAAERAISGMIKPTDPAIASSVQIDPHTGLIVAMAQSRPKMGKGKGETFLNYNVEAKYGDAMGFQAGSTFKIFAVAAALEAGFTRDHKIEAPTNKNFRGETFKNCEGSFVYNSDWKVSNAAGGDGGIITLTQATRRSVNTAFVNLTQQVGICNITDVAKRSGVKLASGKDLNKEMGSIASFVLGSAEVTPLSIAEAYATFANRGVHCNPLILKSVQSKAGKKFAVPPGKCTKVIEPHIADGVNDIMSQVMEPGGTGVPALIPGGWHQAGKTGTTDSNEAVWFAGYTPEMAGIAMISVDKAPQYAKYWKQQWRGRSLKGWTTPSGTYLQGSGGGDAGQIYKIAMAEALKGKPNTRFRAPGQSVLQGKKIAVPSTSGMGYEETKRTLEAAGFTTTTGRRYSDWPEGTYIGHSAWGVSSLRAGSTIVLYLSSGSRPEPRVRTRPTQQPTKKAEPQPSPKPEPKPSPKPEPKPQPSKKPEPSAKPSKPGNR